MKHFAPSRILLLISLCLYSLVFAGQISYTFTRFDHETKYSDPSVRARNLLHVLSSFTNQKIRLGNVTYLLDKRGLKHILERHHPKYWDGSIKSVQTFFDKNMSIESIVHAITMIMNQNKDFIIKQRTNGMYRISGIVDGVEYIVGFNRGRIGQFYVSIQ